LTAHHPEIYGAAYVALGDDLDDDARRAVELQPMAAHCNEAGPQEQDLG
jgi:hypothetical protein